MSLSAFWIAGAFAFCCGFFAAVTMWIFHKPRAMSRNAKAVIADVIIWAAIAVLIILHFHQ